MTVPNQVLNLLNFKFSEEDVMIYIVKSLGQITEYGKPIFFTIILILNEHCTYPRSDALIHLSFLNPCLFSDQIENLFKNFFIYFIHLFKRNQILLVLNK